MTVLFNNAEWPESRLFKVSTDCQPVNLHPQKSDISDIYFWTFLDISEITSCKATRNTRRALLFPFWVATP